MSVMLKITGGPFPCERRFETHALFYCCQHYEFIGLLMFLCLFQLLKRVYGNFLVSTEAGKWTNEMRLKICRSSISHQFKAWLSRIWSTPREDRSAYWAHTTLIIKKNIAHKAERCQLWRLVYSNARCTWVRSHLYLKPTAPWLAKFCCCVHTSPSISHQQVSDTVK